MHINATKNVSPKNTALLKLLLLFFFIPKNKAANVTPDINATRFPSRCPGSSFPTKNKSIPITHTLTVIIFNSDRTWFY